MPATNATPPPPSPPASADPPLHRPPDYTVDETTVTKKVTIYVPCKVRKTMTKVEYEWGYDRGILGPKLVLKEHVYYETRMRPKTVPATFVRGRACNALDPTDVFEYSGVSYDVIGGPDGDSVTYAHRVGCLLQPEAPTARRRTTSWADCRSAGRSTTAPPRLR
jgi:hypothetical protein